MYEKFDVILESYGSLRVSVSRVVYKAINAGDPAAALVAANMLVKSAPIAIKNGLSKDEAESLKAELEAVAAKVSLRAV